MGLWTKRHLPGALLGLTLAVLTFFSTGVEDFTAPPLKWLELANSPTLEQHSDATVMPVLAVPAVKWPGSTVQLNVIEPGVRQMYDDILLSGSRTFVLTFRKGPRGIVRYAELQPEDCQLHEMGCVLYLEDLQEVSDVTVDVVKYVTEHSVRGRARLRRLLNPSSFFRTNEKGHKVDYLRAEVELLEENRDDVSSQEAKELAELWNEVRRLAEIVGEPSFEERAGSPEQLAGLSTWQLASIWQELQIDAKVRREQRLRELGGGNVPGILTRYAVLDQSFWEPLLQVVAAESAQDRTSLLMETAREEARLMRTRASLRNALDM